MSLFASYRSASAASNRSLWSLLLEAARLRVSRQRLGLSEYLDFQLYRDDLTSVQKSEFGGIRFQGVLEEILIDDYSRFLSLDKVTMYGLMKGLNLPIPEVRATYQAIRPAALRSLSTTQELAQFLADPGNLPVYVKKAFGSYGRGNAQVQKCENGTLSLGNDKSETLETFCASLGDGQSLGWILQEPMVAHPDIALLTGSSKVSGLRLHTFLGRRGPELTHAIFKINLGHRDSDNFEHGASGNMLAAVDLDSGRIVRAITGVGLAQKEVSVHPNTGRELLGFEIPHWSAARQLVLDGQTGFPGFLCPGWDIAICADGPKILEVNAFGDIDLSQHATRRPFLNSRLRALLQERGLDALLYVPGRSSTRGEANGRLGIRRHHWPW